MNREVKQLKTLIHLNKVINSISNLEKIWHYGKKLKVLIVYHPDIHSEENVPSLVSEPFKRHLKKSANTSSYWLLHYRLQLQRALKAHPLGLQHAPDPPSRLPRHSHSCIAFICVKVCHIFFCLL